MYTEKDCIKDDWREFNLEGKYLILQESFFKPKFQDEKFQIVRATGGFGCDPNKIGNAIYVSETHSDNPENYRIERCNGYTDILGIAKAEVIEKHLEKYGKK